MEYYLPHFRKGTVFAVASRNRKQTILFSNMPVKTFQVNEINRLHGLDFDEDDADAATDWMHEDGTDVNITNPKSAVKQWLWIEMMCAKKGSDQNGLNEIVSFIQRKFKVNVLHEEDPDIATLSHFTEYVSVKASNGTSWGEFVCIGEDNELRCRTLEQLNASGGKGAHSQGGKSTKSGGAGFAIDAVC